MAQAIGDPVDYECIVRSMKQLIALLGDSSQEENRIRLANAKNTTRSR